MPWQKSSSLVPNHTFQPVEVETTGGVIRPDTLKFLKTLGRRIRDASGKGKSFPYLIQHLAVAIQRGNAGTFEGISEDFSFHNHPFAPYWSSLGHVFFIQLAILHSIVLYCRFINLTFVWEFRCSNLYSLILPALFMTPHPFLLQHYFV